VLDVGKLVRNSPNVIGTQDNSKPALEVSLVIKACKKLETTYFSTGNLLISYLIIM
jgi:hypothetical protein